MSAAMDIELDRGGPFISFSKLNRALPGREMVDLEARMGFSAATARSKEGENDTGTRPCPLLGLTYMAWSRA